VHVRAEETPFERCVFELVARWLDCLAARVNRRDYVHVLLVVAFFVLRDLGDLARRVLVSQTGHSSLVVEGGVVRRAKTRGVLVPGGALFEVPLPQHRRQGIRVVVLILALLNHVRVLESLRLRHVLLWREHQVALLDVIVRLEFVRQQLRVAVVAHWVHSLDISLEKSIFALNSVFNQLLELFKLDFHNYPVYFVVRVLLLGICVLLSRLVLQEEVPLATIELLPEEILQVLLAEDAELLRRDCLQSLLLLLKHFDDFFQKVDHSARRQLQGV